MSQPPRKKQKLNNGRAKAKPLVGKITGMTSADADMKVAFVAQSARPVNSKPKFASNPNGDVTITYREFVGDVTGSTAFTLQPLTGFFLNAGNKTLFPWLSTIASRYEMYCFDKCHITYEPTCPTSTLGSIAMAVDYDAGDVAPSSKVAILNTRDHARAAPWEPCVIRCSPKDLHRRKTYYNTTVDDYRDEYATGLLYLSTTGQANSAVIGELYVDYVVKLISPQLDLLNYYPYDYYTAAASLLSTQLWGTGGAHVFDIVLAVTNAATATFAQSGRYFIVLRIAGTGASTNAVQNGTATATNMLTYINASGLSAEVSFSVDNAVVGQTVNISMTWTTVTSVIWRIMPAK